MTSNSDYANVLQKVIEIPHLDLGIGFDAKMLLKEVEDLGPDIFQPYKSRVQNLRPLIAKSWQGFSICSPDGSLHNDLEEDHDYSTKTMQRTPAAERMPYTMRVINTLGSENVRARIMRVMPGGQLSWHSHQFDYATFQPENIVVHVPISVPDKFRYSVINIVDYRVRDIEKEGVTVYTQNYPAGRATMFNCVHMHNVFNDSDVPRISMMLNLNINNHNTFEIVKNAVEKYEGPLLKLDI
jgi:hypothetical protein